MKKKSQVLQTELLLSESQDSCQSQNSDHQFDPQFLTKTLKTLKKLKRIGKKKKLTQLKQKNQMINKIFKKMSQIFFFKARNQHKKDLQKKKLEQERKQKLKKVGIRNKKDILLPLSGDKNSQQCQVFQKKHSFLQQQKIQLHSLKCYICKGKFTVIHEFYDCLCQKCGDFNFLKRKQNADLKNMTALVTGGRIKIGFQIALKLLRDGATVIATSRFFNDTLLRYQKQIDYHIWAERLLIIQCDFTSSEQVCRMIEKVKSRFKKIDILINNAAQTIVRPKQFYLQQLINSIKAIDNLPNHMRQFQPQKNEPQIMGVKVLAQRYPSLYLPEQQSNHLFLENQQASNQDYISKLANSSNQLIDHSVRDEFNQPRDKRSSNSWVEKLDQVSLIDCYTTQLINSIVPFHLISQLKPLMKKTPSENPSFIINVSSMEGVFYRPNKQSAHPHTNMAKAALNMITRTSAKQFAQDNIFMSSVDTGWVTEQNPQGYNLERKIPLDCVDGAMRVLDPIYTWKLTGQKHHGQFLKDYKESNW